MKKILTKLKISLTNNVGIKVIAVLVAALMWLAVININDPEKTVTIYNVPITMTHEKAITDMGMVYNLESASNINITISGKRSVVGNLAADDFIATASLAEMSKVNAIPVEVSTKIKSTARKITIVKQSVQTVKVSVEEIEKKEFHVEVEFTGSAAEGYVPGNYSLSKNTVSIKAPESELYKIARVVAVCNLENNSSDISQKCDVVMYDKKGRIIKSKNITISNKRITIYVNILKEKEVPIKINSVGKPADGYKISDISLSQDNVKLVGADEVLSDIEQLDINENIDISRDTKDVKRKIDLNKYIPEGVSISGKSEVEIQIKIDKLEVRTYTIKAEDISVKNLKNNLELKISDKSVKISLRGEKSELDKLDEGEIKASIDLEGYDKGTSKVPLNIEIPEEIEVTEQPSVKVKIK